MKSITLSFPAVVITTATAPFESFEDGDGKTVRGSQRRQVWLLIEPGEPPLECKVADDCADWHDLVRAQGERIVATVRLRAFSNGGNKAVLGGDLLSAGPYVDDSASVNGRRESVSA